jgi:ActR/RegA family two-component response regulator
MRIVSLSGLGTQAMAKWVQALTLGVVEYLELTTEQRADVSQVVEAIQHYIKEQINETFAIDRNLELVSLQKLVKTCKFSSEKCSQKHSLRELVKTCKFSSEECSQKHIRDETIEGLIDGDAV